MKNEKELIKNGIIEIEKNTIKYEDSYIQINNISEIRVAPLSELVPKWVKMGLFISILILIISLMIKIPGWQFTGVCGIFSFGVLGIYLYSLNLPVRYLILGLNSGKNIYFICSREIFLYQVLDKIKECLNYKEDESEKYEGSTINFQNCSITAEQIGDFNTKNGTRQTN